MPQHVVIEYETSAPSAAQTNNAASSSAVPFASVARMPSEGFDTFESEDNVAIATSTIPEGTAIRMSNGKVLVVDTTVLEGHRFCVAPIKEGDMLTSWSLPFAVATRPIQPGQYVCNALTLKELGTREDVTFALPTQDNFRNIILPYQMNDEDFVAEPTQVPETDKTGAVFQGYLREGDRGVGTRNAVLVLGSSSRTATFAAALCERFLSKLTSELADGTSKSADVPPSKSTAAEHGMGAGLASLYPNVDGVYAIRHTEGGSRGRGQAPNNLGLVLRTLAGFIVHPNVGGALVIDYGDEHASGDAISRYLKDHDYPLQDTSTVFLTLTGSYEDDMAAAEAHLRELCLKANQAERSTQPASQLMLALQCGGSDAFSGVSGNPLAGHLAKLLIQVGGAAVQAETDELVGAES